MRRHLLKLLPLFLLSVSGCATGVYEPPESFLSADYQRSVSKCIEKGLAGIAHEFKGRRVSIEVASLGQEDEKAAAFDKYFRNSLEEAVIRGGGKVFQDDSQDSDLHLKAFVFTLGGLTEDRNLNINLKGIYIPIYYSGSTDGVFETLFVIEDRAGNTRKLISGGRETTSIKDTYLFRVFGPYDAGL